MKHSNILITEPTEGYSLLDSGDGEKLEKFGSVTLHRPDPQALWQKKLSAEEWKKADGYFTREEKGGNWAMKPNTPLKWEISFAGLKFWIKPTAFKHTGIFPEQSVNWSWFKEKIGARSRENEAMDSEKKLNSAETSEQPVIEILNLFGYTGGASMACAQAGAQVVHIDSSKSAVTWARENAEISGLAEKPIRWIIEDVRLFVEREIKRGRMYDGIIMDPPAFGHGPTNELWKIEEHFLPLIENCKKLLKDKPLFFAINGYSAGYSAVAYENNLLPLVEKYGGVMEIGELAIQEVGKARLLPSGIFARWSMR
ncbi:MAG: class I SAM-dependent methyltransferase [bacterium]|nr:class I SAM-dependent methyltransferase [bacterium]